LQGVKKEAASQEISLSVNQYMQENDGMAGNVFANVAKATPKTLVNACPTRNQTAQMVGRRHAGAEPQTPNIPS